VERSEFLEALRETGEALRAAGHPGTVRVVICGGAAAILGQGAFPRRVTLDCDVVHWSPEESGEALIDAAHAVGASRGLPERWLNTDSRIYANLPPRGWRTRCELVGRFGSLRVEVVSRLDLMGMKLASTEQRPQDFEDVIALNPTSEEIIALRQHLTRLREESLDREEYEAQFAILDRLETR
jgi:hypothetical protein